MQRPYSVWLHGACGQSCTRLRTMLKKMASVCAINSCSMQKYAWVMTCQKLTTVHRALCSVSQQKQALLQPAVAVNTAVCCQRTTQCDVHPIDVHAQTLCLACTKPICKQKGLKIAGFTYLRWLNNEPQTEGTIQQDVRLVVAVLVNTGMSCV